MFWLGLYIANLQMNICEDYDMDKSSFLFWGNYILFAFNCAVFIWAFFKIVEKLRFHKSWHYWGFFSLLMISIISFHAINMVFHKIIFR